MYVCMRWWCMWKAKNWRVFTAVGYGQEWEFFPPSPTSEALGVLRTCSVHCGRKRLYGWPRAREPKCCTHSFWKIWLTVTKLCVLRSYALGMTRYPRDSWAMPGPWFMTSLLMTWQIEPKMCYKYFAIMTHFGQRTGKVGISWHLGRVLGRWSGFRIVSINHTHHFHGWLLSHNSTFLL